ncbi:hypothetical protein M8J75_006561 [Diaphorina citri]|nr:hypothetical protein M8J75_006561 [Diaphorina citri]
MEKAIQSPGQSSPKDLPRLRGRPKLGLKDDKPIVKKVNTKNDTVGSKSPVTSEQRAAKRSLRSNAAQEVGKVKLRSSLKSNQDASKKLSPGKKILKKSQGSPLPKKGKSTAAEESVLRNGKRKRKAQSPIFPDKEVIKKKVKKIVEDSNSSSSTPLSVTSKDEDLDDEEFVVVEKVKSKRPSLDDATSINSKSESEEKDGEDILKKESEIITKLTNPQMKIKHRKKKSRSIEKTGGNIWAVDSNGSELVVSDTASNTSRRSSLNSITSENNSNSMDIKIDQVISLSTPASIPMTSEQTIPNLFTNNNQVEEIKSKTEQTCEVPPVKTQLVVPFSINNKPVSKSGNKIKRLNIFTDDTTDNTDSDALVIDTDTCVTDDEESSLFKPKAPNKNPIASNNTFEMKDKEQKLGVDDPSLTNLKNVENDNTNVEEDNKSQGTLPNHNTDLKSELLSVTEYQPECDENKPKNMIDEQSCDNKEMKICEKTNNDVDKSIENQPDSSSSLSTKDTPVCNAQNTVELDNNSTSDEVPIKNPPSDIDNVNIKNDESKTIVLAHESNKVVDSKKPNEINENKGAIEIVPTEKSNEVVQIAKSKGVIQNESKGILQSEQSNVAGKTSDEIKQIERPTGLVKKESNEVVIENTEKVERPKTTGSKTSMKENDTASKPEIVLNDETFLNPETGLLENIDKSKRLEGDKSKETKVSVEAVLNVSIDNDVEKVKGNFISPDLISTKVDENVSLYEDTDMIEAEKKQSVEKCEALEMNENISTEFDSGLKDEKNLPDEEMKEIIGEQSSSSEVLVTAKIKTESTLENSTPNENSNIRTKNQDQDILKNDFKGILLEESDELRELEEFPCSLVEIKKKTDFLKNLKLQSATQLSVQGQDANKKSKVSFGIKETCAEKDENYTGTLKVTLTRKRDGEKKTCDADHMETEDTLEYKICPKRVHKLNYKNFPLTLMNLFDPECSQSPSISFYKPNNHYKQDYSYRVLTYVGPVEKDDVPSAASSAQESAGSSTCGSSHSGANTAACNSAAILADAENDSNVKPTRKKIVIPEKSSSFSIHPERFCADVCNYCYTKFGTLDTPCHIAQLKSLELQDHVLKSITAMGTNLSSDSCVCDACYRRVIRMSQEKDTPVPVKKKKKRSQENIPCHVPDCTANGIHNVTKKVFHKIRRTLRNKLSIGMERLTSATPLNLCSDHYHWVLVALRCYVCEKRQTKQVSEPRAEREATKAQLELEGIEVQMVEHSSYICKLCKYFCTLLPRKTHLTHGAKDFFDSYKVTLLNKNHSTDHDTNDDKPVSSDDSNAAAKTETSTVEAETSIEKSEESSDGRKSPVRAKKSPSKSKKSPKKEEPEERSTPEPAPEQPVKLPGEDDIVLHTDLDISNPAKSSSATLERFNTTIQFDTETKKLYQSLLRPYGNQSSFLRHLVILEKYFREGNLVLKEGASSKSQRYINTVNNRIQACNGVVHSPVNKNSAVVSSDNNTPQAQTQSTASSVSVSTVLLPVVSITSTATSNVNSNTTSITSVNQIALTPEVSVLPATNVNPASKLSSPKWPQIQRPPNVKLVKNKSNPKPPMPGLNPIEKPVEIISSPEISLYNIPPEMNGANSKRLRASPALEITPDVSISKTYIPKMKSISSSVPISHSNLNMNSNLPSSSPNTSQPNVVFFLPPSAPGNPPIVTFSQASNMQATFDPRRQSLANTKVFNTMPRVSKAGTPPRLVISNIRSLAPPSAQNNINTRPRRNSNELRFPVGNPPTSGELLLAAFPTLVNNNITVRGPTPNPNPNAHANPNQNTANMGPGPLPNYMIFPHGPRTTSPNISTSIIPPISLLGGGHARSLSGSQLFPYIKMSLVLFERTTPQPQYL